MMELTRYKNPLLISNFVIFQSQVSSAITLAYLAWHVGDMYGMVLFSSIFYLPNIIYLVH